MVQQEEERADLSSSVDVSDRITDSHSTHHLIVEECVESSDGAREAWGHRCICCYRHWLNPSFLRDQEGIGSVVQVHKSQSHSDVLNRNVISNRLLGKGKRQTNATAQKVLLYIHIVELLVNSPIVKNIQQ